MGRNGEIKLSELADIVGVHYRTAVYWAKEALTDGRSPLAKESVRRSPAGRYYVQADEAARISRLSADDLY